ncbi:unnamed protein product [Macrosiphum euphorbiae]|uniref:Uncharacterized protein n=1 Tax=Macrosiphum euphorbiae TaxID=13131 RepID=A0AAV0X191_9HEMI|nr:unnamed protein product [Macrosiphum euphorbiae]
MIHGGPFADSAASCPQTKIAPRRRGRQAMTDRGTVLWSVVGTIDGANRRMGNRRAASLVIEHTIIPWSCGRRD